eukprot:g5823.t1
MSNARLFKRELLFRQRQKSAEEQLAMKQRRLENFRKKRPGLFHDYGSDFSTGVKLCDPSRENYVFANKTRRKLPFSANYMGSMPLLSPAENTRGPGEGVQPLQWVKDPKNQSSFMISSKRRSSWKKNKKRNGEGTPFLGPRKFQLPGNSQASMPRAKRKTTDWLIVGAPDLREGFLAEEDDWGEHFDSFAAVEKELGTFIEEKKTPLSLQLWLKKNYGIILSQRSLQRLFDRGKVRIQKRQHVLRMIYGNMLRKREKRFPEALTQHVTKIGPGEYYSPETDLLSLWGSEIRKSKGTGLTHTYRCPPIMWKSGKTTCNNSEGGSAYSRRKALGDTIGRLRYDKRLSRRKLRGRKKAGREAGEKCREKKSVEGRNEAKGQRETLQMRKRKEELRFELPEQLRGRNVAALRIKLGSIADEAREKVTKENDEVTTPRENRLLWGAFEKECHDIRLTVTQR